ncbi:signal peptide peptidase SppA [Kushneria marisflavi]|uniref:Signal peptide peptidase SppA n=1 Tax=Kushneria marisflavi TaxID=157779 RepID=A0A240UK16_9GAMM|nr:signal peptide peptidase SppA [Kushneria marisflavi]ART61818.1 signal peptide peptidase SppA [Kushneria marisflavi]RKD86851.1 protease-4 [Kushneria marisflavi]
MSDRKDQWTGRDLNDDGIAAEGRSGEGIDRDAMMERWLLEMVREQRRTRRWKIFFRLLFWSFWIVIAAAVVFMVTGEQESMTSRKVGVVKIEGVIDSQSPASAERVIRGLNDAWQGPETAVVLDINSPGGSPVQSQRIYDEIRRLRSTGDKPIIAVIEDIGASGAYYIASAADKIYAAPASLVGSIGVIYSGFGFEGAMEKLGIERRVFTAGENKDMLDPFQPVSDAQRRFWQHVLDQTHDQFINAVKAGRGDRLSDDPALFSGLVWTGEEAVDKGLTDGLKSVDDVARDMTGSAETKDYTQGGDPLEQISRHFGQIAAEYLGLDIYAGSSPVRLR